MMRYQVYDNNVLVATIESPTKDEGRERWMQKKRKVLREVDKLLIQGRGARVCIETGDES